MSMQNIIGSVGILEAVNLTKTRCYLRGTITVSGQKYRVDMRHDGAAANLAADLEKAADLVGKRVVVNGTVQDGTWYDVAANELHIGQRYMAERIREYTGNGEDRMEFIFDACRLGDELFYSKAVGNGCLKFFGHIEELEAIPEGQLVNVILRKERTLTDEVYGYETVKTFVKTIREFVGGEYGLHETDEVEDYRVARPEFEARVIERAREYAEWKANH